MYSTPVISVGGGGGCGGAGGADGFYRYHNYYFPQQSEEGTLMALTVPEMIVTTTIASLEEATTSDGAAKKIRKPYTITKSRESWTEEEHKKFLDAILLYDRDWKKIESFVGSKTVIQIRSHAQKYFQKVQKNGTTDHVPPPRPKRKASHPYPHKATKNAQNVSQPTNSIQSSSCLLEQGSALRSDSAIPLRNSASSGTLISWDYSSSQPVNVSQTRKDYVGPSQAIMNHGSNSESSRSIYKNCEAADHRNHVSSLHTMPDFGQVYSFIGCLIDPCMSGNLPKLKEMNPVDVETVLVLMRNLSINLSSPDFEDQRRQLSSYGVS
ncbi:protein REVEILLE 6-like [Phalaenopsis equestris]|uniref:protein REVEILLE 6-like n=1 Tax=Phalaenopsis equestris TaxID=78828 RepID=UPI0009E56430|nr:protein REVEILLE 6-like [Phalaenopsis equestris]